MPVSDGNVTKASEQTEAEGINGNNDQISSEFIDQKFRTNLQPVTEQISNINQLLNQLVPENSEKLTATVGPRTYHPKKRLSPEGQPVASKITPGLARGGSRDTSQSVKSHFFCFTAFCKSYRIQENWRVESRLVFY